MASKGKRRASQRVRASKETEETACQRGGPQQKASSPVTPPCNKKRRVVNSSGVNALPEGTVDMNIPANQNERRSRTPEVRINDGHRNTSRVETPPSSRRSLQPVDRRRSVPSRDESVAQDAGVVRIMRTAETIPEDPSSTDRDVHMIHRQPLDSNALYRRYVANQFDEERGSRDVVRQVFSPMSVPNVDSPSIGGDRHRDGQDRVLEESPDHISGEFSNVPPSRIFVDEHTKSLSITREMLSSFQRDFEQKLFSEMKNLHTFISEKFRAVESLESNLTRQLNEFRVVTSSGRSPSCSQGRPTPLARYEAKLDVATPHADWVFNTESLCMILRVNLCMFVVGLANERGNTLDNISLALRAILFGLLPSQKRSAFSNGVGRLHSKFRFTVVLNILFNVQQNVFMRFLPVDLSIDGGNAEVVNIGNTSTSGAQVLALDNSVMQIKQPQWLKSGFVRKSHVEEARARIECNNGGSDGLGDDPVATGKQKKPWLTVKETPHRDDIARYGALKVYRSVTTGLYQAREKARWMLFEELTYILSMWEDDDGDVDQHTLTLKWGDDIGLAQHRHSSDGLSSVPDCINRKVGASKADDENQFIIAEFLSSHREMVLLVSHEVRVRVRGGLSRQRRALEVRVLRRAVNLIDVAAKFSIVFTEQSVGEFSNIPFLGGHPDSLKCVYAIALMLRGLVDSFIDGFTLGGKFSMPKPDNIPPVECHNLSLEHLLPAASVRKRLLMSRCLRMGNEDFEKLNLRESDKSRDGILSQIVESPEDRIDVHDHGVLLL